MKLFFTGHAYKYAAEQMLLTLFPQERPEYPAESPAEGGDALYLTLEETKTQAIARAVLTYGGARFEGVVTVPPPPAPKLERDRVLQRALKNAFYSAGVAALGHEPPWGSLTGVRPVKIPTRAMEGGASPTEADGLLQTLYHVSAPRRKLAMDCAGASLAVKRSLSPQDISLYIGIPFCPTRCAYCSFVSSTVGKTFGQMEPYLDALCREIAAAGTGLRRVGKRVRSAYMGGGTPTTLSAPQLDRVLAALGAAFDLSHCGEFTVEAGRPDTITAEKLAVLRAHGVGRVSVNPQTLEPHVLAAIGRAHTVEDFFKAWALAREIGFPYANVDLIAGLPQDTVQGFSASLDGVIALEPENITVHTLALKKGSRLIEEGRALPPAGAVATMLDYAWAALGSAGYVPYYLYRQKYMSGGFENVGWSKPGGESIYNICMMEELHGILSLGAGGITKLVNPVTGRLDRLCNPKYAKEYIQTIDRMITEKEELAWPIS